MPNFPHQVPVPPHTLCLHRSQEVPFAVEINVEPMKLSQEAVPARITTVRVTLLLKVLNILSKPGREVLADNRSVETVCYRCL
jgi:hypothetical protein